MKDREAEWSTALQTSADQRNSYFAHPNRSFSHPQKKSPVDQPNPAKFQPKQDMLERSNCTAEPRGAHGVTTGQSDKNHPPLTGIALCGAAWHTAEHFLSYAARFPATSHQHQKTPNPSFLQHFSPPQRQCTAECRTSCLDTVTEVPRGRAAHWWVKPTEGSGVSAHQASSLSAVNPGIPKKSWVWVVTASKSRPDFLRAVLLVWKH